MSQDNIILPADLRPVMVRTGDHVRPAVAGEPSLSSGPTFWPGYFLEELRIDSTELPSGSSLTSHAILAVVACDSDTRIFWRDRGRQRTRLVHPGDVFLRSREEFDEFRWNKPMVVRLLGIQHDTLINLTGEAVLSGCEFVSTNAARDPYIPHVLERLAFDLQAGSPAGGLYGESLCGALALYGLRTHGQRPIRRCEYKNGLPASTLTRVLDYIFANLGHELTILELASVAGHTPNSFRKLFEKSVRRPVHRFVLDARVESAKALLKETDINLSTVATAVGFCHQSHFSDAFRRRTGLSPARYRAEIARGPGRGAFSFEASF